MKTNHRRLWAAVLALTACLGGAALLRNEKAGEVSAASGPLEPRPAGAVLFESNRDAVKDKVKSVYLWLRDDIEKICTGCTYPRWHPNKNIAAISDTEIDGTMAHIAIVDFSAPAPKLQKFLSSRYVFNLAWAGENKLVYVGGLLNLPGAKWAPDSHLILYDLSTQKETELAVINRIRHLSASPDGKRLALEMLGPFPGRPTEITQAAIYHLETNQLEPVYPGGMFPVLLPDGKTLLVITNNYPDDKYIQAGKFAVLARYDMTSKEFEIIRPVNYIESMTLSRDGSHVVISEHEPEAGVVIKIYSLDNLQSPVHVIEPEETSFGRAQYINADWNPQFDPNA